MGWSPQPCWRVHFFRRRFMTRRDMALMGCGLVGAWFTGRARNVGSSRSGPVQCGALGRDSVARAMSRERAPPWADGRGAVGARPPCSRRPAVRRPIPSHLQGAHERRRGGWVGQGGPSRADPAAPTSGPDRCACRPGCGRRRALGQTTMLEEQAKMLAQQLVKSRGRRILCGRVVLAMTPTTC